MYKSVLRNAYTINFLHQFCSGADHSVYIVKTGNNSEGTGLLYLALLFQNSAGPSGRAV